VTFSYLNTLNFYTV